MPQSVGGGGPKYFKIFEALIVLLFITCAGSEATLERLTAMLEAIGCFEGAEICREQGMYMMSMRTTCLPQLTR